MRFSRFRLCLAAAALAAFLPALPCAGMSDEEDCGDCHDDVPPSSEVHEDFACTDCHYNVEEVGDEPHDEDIVGPAWRDVVCGDCHEDENDEFHASVHGRVSSDLPERLRPRCTSCHGDIHSLVFLDAPHSPLFPKNVASTCATCHADEEMSSSKGIRRAEPVSAYRASVHGRAVMRGVRSATCNDCHGSHDIQPASNPASRVSRAAVPQTCGRCHSDIAELFASSIHGKAAAAGVEEAPVCTDCHGEHRILEPARKDSPVYATNIPKMTCGRCHGDLRLTEKFGIGDHKVVSYEDSFHGLASRSGKTTVANCASCHGVHDILPSSDPRSHVYKDNLPKTCGGCHPGAGASFAIGPVHVLEGDAGSEHPAVHYARLVYLWIIALTIGSMLLHNGLDLYRKTASGTVRPVARKKRGRERLSPAFRLAHGVLAISFIVLAVTGFALKYPDAVWSKLFLTWDNGVDVRGWLHRIAAVAMLSAFAFHFVHLLVDRRARRCIAAMAPSRHDAAELREKFRWYLGWRDSMPKSPDVGYVEKVEYLALIWGTFVMATTGFSLWFENWSLAHFPKWVTDLATVVHLYEAVLATLAILFWHMYFVIFDPLVYPMDSSWLTGREAPGRSFERSGEEGPPPDPNSAPS